MKQRTKSFLWDITPHRNQLGPERAALVNLLITCILEKPFPKSLMRPLRDAAACGYVPYATYVFVYLFLLDFSEDELLGWRTAPSLTYFDIWVSIDKFQHRCIAEFLDTAIQKAEQADTLSPETARLIRDLTPRLVTICKARFKSAWKQISPPIEAQRLGYAIRNNCEGDVRRLTPHVGLDLVGANFTLESFISLHGHASVVTSSCEKFQGVCRLIQGYSDEFKTTIDYHHLVFIPNFLANHCFDPSVGTAWEILKKPAKVSNDLAAARAAVLFMSVLVGLVSRHPLLTDDQQLVLMVDRTIDIVQDKLRLQGITVRFHCKYRSWTVVRRLPLRTRIKLDPSAFAH